MPNGDITQLDPKQFRAKLLDAQNLTSTGAWVEVPPGFPYRSFESTTLEEGASDATVDIMISNDEAKPSDATAGPITQTLDTTTQAASKTEPYRWVKAAKTQGTTPINTTVIMVATKSE